MSPWWLRPGPEEEQEQEQEKEQQASDAAATPPAPAVPAPEDEVRTLLPGQTWEEAGSQSQAQSEDHEPAAAARAWDDRDLGNRQLDFSREAPAESDPEAQPGASWNAVTASPAPLPWHEDDDLEEEDEEDDEEDEITEGEPLDGLDPAAASETSPEAVPADTGKEPGRPGRRRGGRGRRGRGRSGGNGGAAAAESAAPDEATEAAPAPVREPSRREQSRREPREPREPRESRESRESREPASRPQRVVELPAPPALDYEPRREMFMATAPPERAHADERKIALFCDFENIALGVRDSDIKKFDINLVLERLLEKGKIIVKKAYADWERYSDYKRALHEAAIELIDIPQKYYSGKNSADIKMVVDAMDLSYSKEHLDTFVVMSGDSDFSPLVSKLKENNKTVIGVGVKNASSALLIDNCDEFIYYEDVWRDRQSGPQLQGVNKKQSEAFNLMVDSIQALMRENKDVLWGSMIKQTMQRKKPSFSEGYYGYSTFSELLEDAERHGIVKLKKDGRSGTYVVTGFASRR